MRVGKYRVFYDVNESEKTVIVAELAAEMALVVGELAVRVEALEAAQKQ